MPRGRRRSLQIDVGLRRARLVQGRGDRNEVLSRIEAMIAEHGVDPGELGGEVGNAPGVEEGAPLRDRVGHSPRNDVPGRQLAPRVELEGEPLSRPVYQERAGPTHRLRHERGRIHATQAKRGGVELEELEVA